LEAEVAAAAAAAAAAAVMMPTTPGSPRIGSDEEMLRMSPVQIEQHIEYCKRTMQLTTDELKHLKSVRRLIKNREYAQQSRDKKKAAVGGMQRELEVAQERIRVLETRNTELERENRMLRETVARLQAPGSRMIGACILSVCIFGLAFAFTLAPRPFSTTSSPLGPSSAASPRALLSTPATEGTWAAALWAVPRLFGFGSRPPKTMVVEPGAAEIWQWELQHEGLLSAAAVPSLKDTSSSYYCRGLSTASNRTKPTHDNNDDQRHLCLTEI
jgi:hypothetical protein